MPRRGFVAVPLSPEQCAASAEWLLKSYNPQPTLLGDPEYTARARLCAAHLANKLEKAGRRKSAAHAVRTLERQLAAWFGSVLDACAVTGRFPPRLVVEAMRACRAEAGKGPRGAKQKHRTADEVDRLALGNPFGESDERYRSKLRRRAAKDARISAWLVRMNERGETLLTCSEPVP